MSDLDIRCARQAQEVQDKVSRIDEILSRYSYSSRSENLKAFRNELLIELHDMKRAHAVFDRRFREACEDPTGQDLDSFEYDFESDSERSPQY